MAFEITLKLYLYGKYSIQTMIFWSLCAFIWFRNIEKMLLQMTSVFLQPVPTLVYLRSSCVNWVFLPKKAQFTQERVEYNGFLFDEPLKGSKSLKIFKISLTFRFDKL
jgi:hypothetical protein